MDIIAIIKDNLPEGVEISDKAVSAIAKEIKRAQGEEFVPKSEYGKKALKIDQLEKQVGELQGKAAEADTYKAELETAKTAVADLQADYDQYKENKEKEITTLRESAESEKARDRVKSAVLKQLEADGANPRLTDLLLSKFDLDKIKLDEKGAPKDWETVSAPVKTAYADVFGEVKKRGVDAATPPAGEPGGTEPGSLRDALAQKYQRKED